MVFRRWGVAHNRADVALSAPAPHAVLLARGHWRQYGMPFPASRYKQGSLGYMLVPGLCGVMDTPGDIQSTAMRFNVVEPASMLRVCDVLRRCYSHLGGNGTCSVQQFHAGVLELAQGLAGQHSHMHTNTAVITFRSQGAHGRKATLRRPCMTRQQDIA